MIATIFRITQIIQLKPRLSDLRKVITGEVSGNCAVEGGEQQTCASWKEIFDRLSAAEVRPTGDTVQVVKGLRVQWVNGAMRLLSNHLREELAPFLGTLGVDIANNVQLHDIPKAWNADALRDPLCQSLGKDDKKHVAFDCHDFLAELYPWHEKVLKDQNVDTALQLSLFKMWDGICQELKTQLQNIDTLESVDGFSNSFQKKLMAGLSRESDSLLLSLKNQIKEALAAETYNETTYEKSVVESMQRLGAVLKAHDSSLAETLLLAGEAGEHFLVLSAACLLYEEKKAKLTISSKPDRLTISILQAFKTTQASALGFFRKKKTFEVSELMLGKDDHDLVERCSDGLTALINYSDVWENELIELMSRSLSGLTGQVKTILDSSLPSFDVKWASGADAESFTAFQKQVKESKLADIASQLLKKTDACLHCCKIGGLPTGFTSEPRCELIWRVGV